MPNWCMNTLTVRGEEAPLSRFKEAAQATITQQVVLVMEQGSPLSHRVEPLDPPAFLPLSFEALRPSPDEMNPLKNPNGRGWLDYRIHAWGTKWELGDDTRVEDWPDMVRYDFDTAWTPPVPVVVAASENHPDLQFELVYGEPGCDFSGRLVLQAGEVIEQNEGVFKDSPWYEESWDEDVECSA